MQSHTLSSWVLKQFFTAPLLGYSPGLPPGTHDVSGDYGLFVPYMCLKPQQGAIASPHTASVCFSRGRLKEKNREAQKKYRERQKGKLQESEGKVSELMEQINALKVEKVRLSTVQSEGRESWARKEDRPSDSGLVQAWHASTCTFPANCTRPPPLLCKDSHKPPGYHAM